MSGPGAGGVTGLAVLAAATWLAKGRIPYPFWTAGGLLSSSSPAFSLSSSLLVFDDKDVPECCGQAKLCEDSVLDWVTRNQIVWEL